MRISEYRRTDRDALGHMEAPSHMGMGASTLDPTLC
jgi:hypothetical protein